MKRRPASSRQDFERLLEQLPPFAKQAVVFLRLTGIRIGELCSMRIEKIEDGVATVYGKTGERSVALSTVAVELLTAVVGDRTNGPVWLNSYGKPLTTSCLQLCLRRKRGAGLEHVVAHGMRGLYATEALRAEVDSFMVAKLLGHTSPAMLIKHYGSPDTPMLKEAAEKAMGKG
jgi:integrase